uniref:Uncharacterized protein n=1 Tax=Steinernema glaseri TaxID=37863 RepID=A0A1I8A4I6_9BILA
MRSEEAGLGAVEVAPQKAPRAQVNDFVTATLMRFDVPGGNINSLATEAIVAPHQVSLHLKLKSGAVEKRLKKTANLLFGSGWNLATSSSQSGWFLDALFKT